MKVALMVLLGIAAIILLNCVYKTSKSKKRIAIPMMKLLRSALVAVCLNFIILAVPVQWLSNFMYSLYFGNISWMMYFMLSFSLEYIGSRPERHINIKLMRLMLALDSISLMLNSVFGHAFSTRLYNTWGGGNCYVYDHGWYMEIHCIFVC